MYQVIRTIAVDNLFQLVFARAVVGRLILSSVFSPGRPIASML
ncbi:hypothetical protein sync_0688 [Synechococcus sp. CC9311]|nr:hypothetical protein sync_0688 [Synechococcus sp. CC9311]